MGALDKFLEGTDTPFDVGSIMSRDVEEMDSAIPPPSLYKYYSASRSAFFADPVIRFTQKTSLNDPFELTKRWAEVFGPEVRTLLTDHIVSKIGRLTDNKGLVLEIVKEEYAKNGIFLSPDQIAEAVRILLSREGGELYHRVAADALNQVSQLVEVIFNYINFGADETFDKLTSELGIFSISESPVSEQMWGLYASAGAGFVIEFDAHHQFFKASNGRNILRKVKYTNEKFADFCANPLSLFQIKGENWAFEQEWRLLKKLTECDDMWLHGGEPIHVCRLKPGMIRSVIFGYNYDKHELAKRGANLRVFDPNIHLKLAFINSYRGEIGLHELL